MDAHQVFYKKIEAVRLNLSLLQAIVETELEPVGMAINWAHVGDLDRLNSELAEIVSRFPAATQRETQFMELGTTHKDVITGFQGVATGISSYISGCTQVLLAPPIDDSGNLREAQWFDIQRLQPVPDTPAFTLNNSSAPGHDKSAPKR